jgi:hypothetical protein
MSLLTTPEYLQAFADTAAHLETVRESLGLLLTQTASAYNRSRMWRGAVTVNGWTERNEHVVRRLEVARTLAPGQSAIHYLESPNLYVYAYQYYWYDWYNGAWHYNYSKLWVARPGYHFTDLGIIFRDSMFITDADSAEASVIDTLQVETPR